MLHRRGLKNLGVAGLLLCGVLFGLQPAPPESAVWAISILYTAVALWLLARSYGWGPALVYAGVVLIAFFGAEYYLVNVRSLLSHRTHPQIAGVSLLALVQDVFPTAFVYVLAAALVPAGGATARAVAAGGLMLVLCLVCGPMAVTWDSYTYNPPFRSWPASLGLDGVPAVPWEEPLGMAFLALVTTLLFGWLRRWWGWDERPFSLRWPAAVFAGLFVLPGWVWASREGHWALFALDTGLLVLVGVLVGLRTAVRFGAAQDAGTVAPNKMLQQTGHATDGSPSSEVKSA